MKKYGKNIFYILLYSGMMNISDYCKWENVINRDMLNKVTVCKKERNIIEYLLCFSVLFKRKKYITKLWIEKRNTSPYCEKGISFLFS